MSLVQKNISHRELKKKEVAERKREKKKVYSPQLIKLIYDGSTFAAAAAAAGQSVQPIKNLIKPPNCVSARSTVKYSGAMRSPARRWASFAFENYDDKF